MVVPLEALSVLARRSLVVPLEAGRSWAAGPSMGHWFLAWLLLLKVTLRV